MKFLDCTLRDGGYYTNWDFDRNLVETYIESFNKLPADYLEIGYRSVKANEYLGQYFYCPDFVMKNFREKSNKKLAIILDEKDTLPEHLDQLLDPCKEYIDLIRIAIDPQNITRAFKLAQGIKSKGFRVGFNVMYMSKWKQFPAFINELGNLNGMADYFYMVDSYGGVYPADVKDTIELVKSKTDVTLGFHGHNNLELGLINSLTALENGVEIIDATVTGMGRGAGNLKTELFYAAMNKKQNLEIDFNSLSAVVDAFEQLRKKHEWGTNLPYMVSGANSLPQKDVMEWVTKRFYSINSIIRALEAQMGKNGDNRKLETFNPAKKYKKIIIIGGGANADLHADAIRHYIEKEKDICIIHASSKNARQYKGVQAKQYFCLVGNEGHRLENVFNDLSSVEAECILPPFPRKMGTYIPTVLGDVSFELPGITFTNRLNDSHTVLSLQTAIILGAEEIGLVGYDGYLEGLISQQDRTLSEENESLFMDFSKNTSINLYSLTATNYKSIKVESVYSKLI